MIFANVVDVKWNSLYPMSAFIIIETIKMDLFTTFNNYLEILFNISYHTD